MKVKLIWILHKPDISKYNKEKLSDIYDIRQVRSTLTGRIFN